MTLKELSNLTQKQIREYALMQNPNLKVPKKWTNKTAAVKWAEANLFGTSKVKATPKKATAKTTVTRGSAIERRTNIVKELRAGALTVAMLADKFGIKTKTITNDIHAIRHNVRNQYLNKNEVVDAVREGKVKTFKVKRTRSSKK